jgi:hypothetical protein
MTESMISRLERGDHVPSLKTLCRIADAFGPGSFHGPELQRIATEEGTLEISIFETGVSPRFRLSGVTADTVTVQTHQGGDERQDFSFANRGTYWESVEQIREPHQFALSVIINHGGHAYRYEAQFTEHGHEHGDVYGHGHDHVERILDWDFDQIIVGHGAVVENNGKEVFRTPFRWLLK